ncbi:GntR family transcriptional regulator [Thioclava dalianensis]|uniref:GntR family transcriptional regulator n=1 Tax=Thioclava dalianensis TaxID=1185766 RepID=A0A074TEZ7_9RHOB|nr:PLP-dependent aminotransferase family protein [Thioclava dalianensis]KEP68725.1 GntR family transcriptional regulator [Thioclava dalianensis]SFN59575.1 DNA-binding transcriptional regulator, MocR family, contains an aminotransferase domain [Thioclava dalianensis]
MTDTNWTADLTRHSGPKYLALVRALREGIRNGALLPGAKLPTVRDLAYSLGVTPGTVARGYQIATQEGLLEAVVGRGTFVSSQSRRLGPTEAIYNLPTRDPDLDDAIVDLRSPQLPDIGQTEALARAMMKAAEGIGRQYLEYPGLKRDEYCRRAALNWFSEYTDFDTVTPDDLVLTHGGQNGIMMVMQCCLRGERPVIYAEALAYPGFRHAARLNRAEIRGIAIDDEGMVPEALDAACRRYGGQLICVTPDAQNPTAGRMGIERRHALIAVARRHDLQIIEDDCYTAPVTGLPSLRSLAPERCWHVTSLSKSISAGMRFGIVVAPDGMGEAGRLTAQHSYFGLSRPVTDMMAHLFETGEALDLKARAQAEMGRRLQMLLQALGDQELGWQSGLSFVWLTLPLGWRASAFARMAEAEGVLLRAADEYALQDGQAPNAVRIALAGGVSEDRFRQAIETLKRLLERMPDELLV